MSIATEITRIAGLRDTIRTKLKSLGLVSDTANLSTCATAMDSVISGVDDMSYSFPSGATKLNTAGKCLPINLYNYEYKNSANRIHVTTGGSISYDSTYATCGLTSSKWYQLKTTATAATSNINVWHYGASSRTLIDSDGNFSNYFGAPIYIPSGLSTNVKVVLTFKFVKHSATTLLPKMRICLWDSTGAWIANDTLVTTHSTDTYLAVTADLDDYYRNKDLAYVTLNFVFTDVAVSTTYNWRIQVQWGKAAGSWYYYNATSPTYTGGIS